jgi:HSP20 family protein
MLAERTWSVATTGCIWRPPTDVYETEQSIVVRMEVAGMREEDFTISFNQRVLSVQGRRTDPGSKMGYQALEIPFGPFYVEVELNPSIAIVPERVTAEYQVGFLLVHIPKTISPKH